jgi:hypothetical protein
MCKILLTGASTTPLIRCGAHKIFDEERAHGESRLIEFCGRDRVHAQRKAVDWWYQHRQSLGLKLCDFLSRCRWSDDRRTITFVHL